MSLFNGPLRPEIGERKVTVAPRPLRGPKPPKRTMPFHIEPGFYEDGEVWLYGNARLLQAHLAFVPGALGPNHHSPAELDAIEAEAERSILDGKVLVSGIHNSAHQRAAVVPLRWGSPRILVLSGGFRYHLGESLDQEPFTAARLWRSKWDALTDLAISRRAPEKLPTFATHNPTIDRTIKLIAGREWPGLLFDIPSWS
ncbi:MAG: hypothetical protein HONBIEJF_02542 [Fimbriimonadaceae bacterium]|nr:hypothetical protein [Fimbriimonadaceae bacterium]